MPATVGLLHLDLRVPEASSLKDKRRIIKSFKDRVANRFRVSIAEVDAQDNHRMAIIAVAMVGSDSALVQGTLQKIANAAAQHRDMILIDQQIELL